MFVLLVVMEIDIGFHLGNTGAPTLRMCVSAFFSLCQFIFTIFSLRIHHIHMLSMKAVRLNQFEKSRMLEVAPLSSIGLSKK